MGDPAFSLNLGNGVYMDSDGGLHNSPLPNVPAYKAPFTLPVDPKKVKDALSSVKDALSDVSKKGFIKDRWGKVDEIDKLLDVVAGIGKVAGMIAPVLGAVGVVMDALKLFGILKDGPSAVEVLINKRMDELKGQVKALADLLQTEFLVTARSEVQALSLIVKNHVDNLPNSDPTPAELITSRNELIAAHNVALDGFIKALDQQTWLANFIRSEHQNIWPMLAGIMNTVPGVPPGTGGTETVLAPVPPDGLNFDHRLMFPFASFAAETYLTCIRGITPEYRTLSEFHAQLMDFANRLSNLASLMRQNVLGRTIYKPEHFNQIFYETGGNLIITHIGPFALPPVLSPNCNFWPVGAMDLRYHDDDYFRDFLSRLALSDVQISTSGGTGKSVTKFGTLDLRWIPPAIFKAGPFPNSFSIANPEECAAAANAQSEQDYADLLSISGYPELMRLAALFRNETLEPAVSQTVVTGKPALYRNPQPATDVTVKSNPVHYTGEVITAQAKRIVQECMCKVTVQTQSLKRATPVKYRVVLRTLDTFEGKDRWRDIGYSDYQIITYENDPNNEGFQRLKIAHAYLETGAKALLEGLTSSPREPIVSEGTVAMDAITFDWWVPTPASTLIHDDFIDHIGKAMIDPWKKQIGMLAGSNALLEDTSDGIMTLTFSGGARKGPTIPELTWQRPTGSPDGQRRDLRKETVHIRYAMNWTADRLQLTLWSEPAERNYVVYLALEEQMASGNVLHTAVALPVDGLVTRVPEQFFIDEFTAHAKTAKIIASLIPKHIPQVGEIGSDEGVAWIRPGDLISPQGVDRVMAQLEKENPQFFQEVVTELQRRSAGIGEVAQPNM